MNLNTTPEEVYRALIEAAFGTRVIVEAFRDAGIPIDEFYACGSLPENALLMHFMPMLLIWRSGVSFLPNSGPGSSYVWCRSRWSGSRWVRHHY